MRLLISFTFLLVLVIGVFGQKEGVTADTYFPGEKPPTVVSLPVPAYPDEVKKANLGGRVSVEVTVDDAGKVNSVDAARGPYPICQGANDPNVLALRREAIEAAKKAIFKPAMEGSKPIGAKGRIIYIFEGYPKPVISQSAAGAMAVSNDTATTVKPGSRPVSTATGTPRIVSGGVLTGTAMELPRPAYPPAARAVHAGGGVSVQVLILENGSVYSAESVSGHPLLRSSAENAACGARFTPTLLEGHPVKVSGIIAYNYVP